MTSVLGSRPSVPVCPKAVWDTQVMIKLLITLIKLLRVPLSHRFPGGGGRSSRGRLRAIFHPNFPANSCSLPSRWTGDFVVFMRTRQQRSAVTTPQESLGQWDTQPFAVRYQPLISYLSVPLGIGTHWDTGTSATTKDLG
jgi:hypothetical protein